VIVAKFLRRDFGRCVQLYINETLACTATGTATEVSANIVVSAARASNYDKMHV
jgi:hypothetical protein